MAFTGQISHSSSGFTSEGPLAAGTTVEAPSGFLSSGIPVLQYAAVTIPTASVLTLNSVPYTILAAPGAGKVNIFHDAMIVLDYNSAAYAGIAAGEDLAVRYTDGSGATVSTTLETTGFLDATSDQIRTLKRITTDVTPVANAVLKLCLASGDITTGDSPLRMYFTYSTWSTGL